LAAPFLPRQVQVGTKSIQHQKVLPTRPLSNKEREITFEFGHYGNQMIKLDSVKFYMRGQIMALNADGSVREIEGPGGYIRKDTPPPPDDFSIINAFPNALFSKIEILAGHNQCKIVTDFYPYRSMVDEIFNQTEDEDKDVGFGSDLAFSPSKDPNSPKGVGAVRRGRWVENSQYCEFLTPTHIPLFQNDSLLPCNTPLIINLTRSPDDFYILSQNDTKYFWEFQTLEIRLDTYELNDIVIQHFEDLLVEKKSSYYLQDYSFKQYQLTEGIESKHIQRCFDPVVPNLAFFCFVEQEGFFGNVKFNPFAFRTLSLSTAKVEVNGQEQISLHLDEEKGIKIELFNKFLHFLGVEKNETYVSSNLFFHHTALFPLELNNTCDSDKGTCDEILRTGIYTLDLKFHKALEKNYLLLVVAIHGSELLVTPSRDCQFENIFP
jgi:hypothetical protein